MSHIFIYAGTGRFTGGDFEWNSPPVGTAHDFMLFLHQAEDAPVERAALAQIKRFGFDDVRLMSEGAKIVVEALNDPGLAPFRTNYEGALRDGSSLAWYP